MYLNEIHVTSIKRQTNMILFVQDRKIIIWSMYIVHLVEIPSASFPLLKMT